MSVNSQWRQYRFLNKRRKMHAGNGREKEKGNDRLEANCCSILCWRWRQCCYLAFLPDASFWPAHVNFIRLKKDKTWCLLQLAFVDYTNLVIPISPETLHWLHLPYFTWLVVKLLLFISFHTNQGTKATKIQGVAKCESIRRKIKKKEKHY